MSITAASIVIAVTSAGAGGRADSQNSVGNRDEARALATPSREYPSADQPSEVAYWHKLAAKRLRLLGARERRIVRLLVRLRRVAPRHRDGRTQPGGVRSAICTVFGAHCSEALRVAWCESRFNVYAQNGQYLGLFQVSAAWRERVPGWGWNSWAQARHAYRVFVIDGSDWSAWECRP